MVEFWMFMNVVVISVAVVLSIFLILVSVPGRLAGWSLRVYSIAMQAVTATLVLYILNPIDLIPDLIPVLGQVDDAAGLVTALMSGVAAVLAWGAGSEKIEVADLLGEGHQR